MAKTFLRLLGVLLFIGTGLTGIASAGTFYVLSCDPDESANESEYGSSYSLLLQNYAEGNKGLTFCEIQVAAFYGGPTSIGFDRWFSPSFTWTIRWVPAYPSEEPPFDEFGSAWVVLKHSAGAGLRDGTGAGVWEYGYGYSYNLVLRTNPGNVLEEKYEWDEPYSGDYVQYYWINLETTYPGFPGYFEYDEAAGDGSWIGTCAAMVQPWYIEAYAEREDFGDGLACPQTFTELVVHTVAGQSPGSTTGGTTGGSTSTTTTGASTSGGTLGGADGGGLGQPGSSPASLPIFPVALAAAVGLGLFVSALRQRS